MSKNLEIEFKTLLTKEEFKDLVHTIHHDKKIIQTNIYFDDDIQTLKTNHAAFRIRMMNQEYFEMTLKTKSHDGHLELNIPLSKKGFENIRMNHQLPHNKEMNESLEKIGTSMFNLKEIANLTTIRYETKLSQDVTIMIDHSQYYDHEDFELEMEVNHKETGRMTFNQFLKDYNIPFRKSQPKILRALQAKNL